MKPSKNTELMTHDEWLRERQKGIGGSDAAAIVGLNSYATPYTVWADKTGKLPPKPDNEAMRQGRDLEDYVAKRWQEESGKKCRRKNYILKNPEYPFAHANVDRWVQGENAGLECKTTSVMNLKKFKNGEYPDNYYVQCVHYMAVTGADRWYLGVLILNQGFYAYVIERDEDEIAALMQTEKEFWQYVVSDEEPPVDGLKPTDEALGYLYAPQNAVEDDPVDLFGDGEDIQTYLQIKRQIKEFEQLQKKLEQQLKQKLGDHTKGTVDNFVVNWKPQTRRTFNAKQYAEDNPFLDLDRYYKTSTFKKFEVKELT